jgi:hypothetical protein
MDRLEPVVLNGSLLLTAVLTQGTNGEYVYWDLTLWTRSSRSATTSTRTAGDSIASACTR